MLTRMACPRQRTFTFLIDALTAVHNLLESPRAVPGHLELARGGRITVVTASVSKKDISIHVALTKGVAVDATRKF